MIDRAREEIARELYIILGMEQTGFSRSSVEAAWDTVYYPISYGNQFGEVIADGEMDKAMAYAEYILALTFNGYTIEELIEMAEKATDGKKVGVYCEDAELPKYVGCPQLESIAESIWKPVGYEEAQKQMLKEGYRKIIKET